MGTRSQSVENVDLDDALSRSQQIAKERNVNVEAVRAVTHRVVTGDWPGYHELEKTNQGRKTLLKEYKGPVERYLEDSVEGTRVKFKAKSTSGVKSLFKDDGKFIIWGPASIEVVDKENDRIKAEALEDALPQLLKRKRLSLDHSDQIVGEIIESFEPDETQSVEIDGHTYERSDFPTAVLDPEDGDDVPEKGLYVCGNVWDDTQQSREVRDGVEQGKYDSYSISGEAVQTATKIEGGDVIDDISALDLSAVTICEDGMNGRAKFGVLSKSDDAGASRRATSGEIVDVGKEALETTFKQMGSNENGDGEPSNASDAVDLEDLQKEFRQSAEDVLKEALPEGELLTRSDVEDMMSEDEDDEEDEMPEDDESEQEEKSEDGESEANEDVEKDERALAESLAEKYDDLDADEVLELAQSKMDEEEDEVDEEEAPDGDEEYPEDEMDEEEDDDVEMSDDDEQEKGNGVMEELKDSLPADLYEAVADHYSEGSDEDEVEMSDDEGEASEEDVDKDDDGEEDEDLAKSMPSAIDEQLESVHTAGGNLEKSHSDGGSESEEEEMTGAADRFY